jgi:hypothetical protein
MVATGGSAVGGRGARRASVGLALVLAAGCGAPAGPSVPPPVAGPTVAVPSPSTGSSTATTVLRGPSAPRSTPAFVADTAEQVGEASGSSALVTSVRVVAQPGYDEVVLELSGAAGSVPGFRVGYVDTPVADPSGRPVAVEGSAYLQVLVSGVLGVPPAGGVPSGPLPVSGEVVTQVVAGASFEGLHQFFVGLDAQRSFRVRASAEPGRVVVQILTP